MMDFKAVKSNSIKSTASDEQMNGFTVTRVSNQCPQDHATLIKSLSFAQAKQNFSMEDIKNIKMLSKLLSSFNKGGKMRHSKNTRAEESTETSDSADQDSENNNNINNDNDENENSINDDSDNDDYETIRVKRRTSNKNKNKNKVQNRKRKIHLKKSIRHKKKV